MRIFAGAVLAALALTACGNETTTDPRAGGEATEPAEEAGNVVDVSMTEYAFGMPEEVTGGTVTFNFTNAGDLPHEAGFVKIDDDRDLDDVTKALDQGGFPKWASDMAGLPVVSSGVNVAMTRDLEEGRYVFLCFLPTPEGEPHAAEGMVHVFDLTGTSDATAPKPHLTITATDDGFEVPEITAGTHTIEFVNAASDDREFALFSLEEGKTMKDINRWFGSGFKTETPALFPGGTQSIESGTSMIMEITFEAGRTYTIEDFQSRTSVEFEVQ